MNSDAEKLRHWRVPLVPDGGLAEDEYL
jgi:hypothetical protein